MTVESAQQYHQNVVHVLRKDITFADDGSTVSVGWLPEGAVVVGGGVLVGTAFDGDTTNTLDIGFRNAADGTADDTDDFATDLALGTAGYIVMDGLATSGGYTSGAEVVGVVTSTASASAGAATIVVEYVVDNS